LPIAMNAACMPTTPPPITSTVAGGNARARRRAGRRAAQRALEHERAGLGGDLACHLTHRREQRQPAVGVLPVS